MKDAQKALIAGVAGAVGLCTASRRLQRALIGTAHVRAVNYHDTPSETVEMFRRHLAYYSDQYVPVGPNELEAALSGNWQFNKPGLLLSFDDGLASNYEIAAPILEEFGWRGWFFVPPDLVESAEILNDTEQMELAHRSRIYPMVAPDQAPRRVFMNWNELRSLAQRHEIGSHTANHCWLEDGLAEEKLVVEIVGSRRTLEAKLERQINSFCWVGGEEYSYSQAAADIVAGAYRFGFMTNLLPTTWRTHPLQVQRTNVESTWPLSLVRFYLSGIMDLSYIAKCGRVRRKTMPRVSTRRASPSR